jgi:hypothetical protein
METAMFGQPRDFSGAGARRPFSLLDPSTWVGS